MDAATFIHHIRESGFTLTEVDGNLAVSPAARLEPVTCATCRHARRHQHPMVATCAAGVDSGTAVGGFWATDRHLCDWYLNIQEAA